MLPRSIPHLPSLVLVVVLVAITTCTQDQDRSIEDESFDDGIQPRSTFVRERLHRFRRSGSEDSEVHRVKRQDDDEGDTYSPPPSKPVAYQARPRFTDTGDEEEDPKARRVTFPSPPRKAQPRDGGGGGYSYQPHVDRPQNPRPRPPPPTYRPVKGTGIPPGPQYQKRSEDDEDEDPEERHFTAIGSYPAERPPFGSSPPAPTKSPYISGLEGLYNRPPRGPVRSEDDDEDDDPQSRHGAAYSAYPANRPPFGGRPPSPPSPSYRPSANKPGPYIHRSKGGGSRPRPPDKKPVRDGGGGGYSYMSNRPRPPRPPPPPPSYRPSANKPGPYIHRGGDDEDGEPESRHGAAYSAYPANRPPFGGGGSRPPSPPSSRPSANKPGPYIHRSKDDEGDEEPQSRHGAAYSAYPANRPPFGGSRPPSPPSSRPSANKPGPYIHRSRSDERI